MTRLPVEIHPEAEAEARDARLWYAVRDPRSATQFMKALDSAIAWVAEHPNLWPPYLHGTRRVLTKRYPFAIIYRVLVDRVLIVAVAHQHRRPDYWHVR